MWGVAGVLALVGDALWRLAPMARSGLAMDLTPTQGVFLAFWLVFMGWSEGYKGFQKLFAPRVVARALALAVDPRPARVVLAPLFVMGLFGATRKRLIVSRVLVAGIVLLVLFVRTLPQPWRGLVDAGVVLGLAWGTIALLVYSVRALMGRPPTIDPDLPEGEGPG